MERSATRVHLKTFQVWYSLRNYGVRYRQFTLSNMRFICIIYIYHIYVPYIHIYYIYTHIHVYIRYILIYIIFIRPHLVYGDVIIDQAYHKSFPESLESLQYNASLDITRAIRGTSKHKLYHKLGLKSLQHRRSFRRLCIFY